VGLLLAFGRRGLLGGLLDRHGIALAFSTPAVVLAEAFVSAPFFIQAAIAAFRRVDESTLLVARTLGASPFGAFRRVALPLSLPALAAGAAMSWARSLGEFGATLLFAGNLTGRTQTLPLAVYTAMRAFDIHAPLPAAGLVLLLMNVATIFPLWPGNVGLVQAAIALPLLSYGVYYARGVAFGIGLQAIEASVGVGPVTWGSAGDLAPTIFIRPENNALFQEGQSVFRWATTKIAPVALRAVELAGLTPADIDVFVPHQANLRIIEAVAKRLGVPYLGGIPLEKAIREEADAGSPVVVSRPDTVGAKAFRDVASAVAARISVQSFRQLPVINVR